MSSELLPCPFCGGEARIETSVTLYRVACGNADCETTSGTYYYKKKEDAIKKWNTRVERTCHFKCKKHWIMYDIYECDECGFEVSKSIYEGGIDFRYCPNCRAKVVEE